MERDIHQQAAIENGREAVMWARLNNARQAVYYATVAAHHALAAQRCARCDGQGIVRERWGQERCGRCGGRGWRPQSDLVRVVLEG